MNKLTTAIEEQIVTNSVSNNATLSDISAYISANVTKWSNKYMIWDLNEFDFNTVSSDAIRSFIQDTIEDSKQRKGLKTALVGQSDLKFGMLRMLSILAFEKYAFPIEAFRDISTAKAWIKENNKNI